MTFEMALRTTEILLAIALLMQCAEHIFWTSDTRLLFVPRAGLCIALLLSDHSQWILLGLSLHSLLILHRYNGPFNGGSDRMGLLVLYCTTLSHWLPDFMSQAAFGYLAVQVILSYFISGQVKICNPEWRSGRALRDVFHFSAYPVSHSLRGLADRPRLLLCASWAVMLFECLFPFSVLNPNLLILAFILAAGFHIANACLFGLNRFVWVWVASYPSILWLQARLI